MKRRRAAVPARRTGAKAVTFAPANAAWQFMPAGTKFNYAAEVGNGLGSSVLVSLLCWLMRTFPQAPAVVERREQGQGQWRLIWDHAMSSKIRRPNPYYSGRVLWMATVLDFAFGNAYWLKVRDGFDDVTELWWMPSALMRPVYGPQWPGVFIHHYEYQVDGRTINVDPKDVVHFRFGIHPDNTRIGYTPLAAMVREIYVDDQASNFTASILRNLGIVGVVVSPKQGEKIPPAKVLETSEYLKQNFTGDKRGQGLVFSNPTDVQVLQYNLQGVDMGPVRDIAEERLSAVLGIPAAVVGFGTGLQQTKVGATMRELIGMAWDNCIEPMQGLLAEELDRSLLPEFQANTGIFRSQFDTSDVRALREDEQQKADRLGKLGEKGFLTVAEVRQGLGHEVRPEHNVYYRPSSVTPVKTPGEIVAPAAAPAPTVPPNDAGNSADASPGATGAKSVTLAAPAPNITVNVPEQAAPIVNITNQIPEQPAPVVNVEVAAPPPANVTVQAPSAHAIDIQRDTQGRVKRIVREG